MCEDCKKCEIKKDSSMICHWDEDYKEVFKDTKRVIICSAKEVRK